jgi:hypothetical protein
MSNKVRCKEKDKSNLLLFNRNFNAELITFRPIIGLHLRCKAIIAIKPGPTSGNKKAPLMIGITLLALIAFVTW